jgi:hypothetical protein
MGDVTQIKGDKLSAVLGTAEICELFFYLVAKNVTIIGSNLVFKHSPLEP